MRKYIAKEWLLICFSILVGITMYGGFWSAKYLALQYSNWKLSDLSKKALVAIDEAGRYFDNTQGSKFIRLERSEKNFRQQAPTVTGVFEEPTGKITYEEWEEVDPSGFYKNAKRPGHSRQDLIKMWDPYVTANFSEMSNSDYLELVNYLEHRKALFNVAFDQILPFSLSFALGFYVLVQLMRFTWWSWKTMKS